MSTSQPAAEAPAAGPSPGPKPKAKPAAKVPALILTLGGAPAEWHVIEGVGHVHPTIPAPVGGDREPSLNVARKLDSLLGCEVKLVEVTAEEAAVGRAARSVARGEGLDAVRQVRRTDRDALPGDVEKTLTEVTAVAGEGA